MTFSFEAAIFAGEQRYNFGFIRERETRAGIEMTFVTPYLDYISRWLLQFSSGAYSNNPELQALMKKRIAELGESWNPA